MTLKKKVELLRRGELVLHCVEVEVFQNTENGIRMQGHGTIKINKVGTVYMEFISIVSQNVPRRLFAERLPKDSLDESQTMYLRARTIEGNTYESKGFSLEINFKSKNPPNLHFLFLSSLECRSKVEQHEPTDGSYLYLEFAENFNVPANKSNSVISTLGDESYSRDQTVIEMDGYSISMVQKEGYTDVRVSGVFDIEEVRSCLKFYIGFSGASMPQFIYMLERAGADKVEVISSISNSQKRQSSVSPMVPHMASREHSGSKYHYDLFGNIICLYRNHPKRYDSIYSQWKMVWHSFQTPNSILALTLSVAIEGLLNDIYIPEIVNKRDNSVFETEIKQIKQLLGTVKLSKEQRSRIMGSVCHWGNVTASKALDYLIEHGVLTKADKALWTKLRNTSAHPKFQDEDPAKEILEHEKVLSCLNTFHKLILNTLSYSGPIALFRIGNEPARVNLTHQEVLN